MAEAQNKHRDNQQEIGNCGEKRNAARTIVGGSHIATVAEGIGVNDHGTLTLPTCAVFSWIPQTTW